MYQNHRELMIKLWWIFSILHTSHRKTWSRLTHAGFTCKSIMYWTSFWVQGITYSPIYGMERTKTENLGYTGLSSTSPMKAFGNYGVKHLRKVLWSLVNMTKMIDRSQFGLNLENGTNPYAKISGGRLHVQIQICIYYMTLTIAYILPIFKGSMTVPTLESLRHCHRLQNYVISSWTNKITPPFLLLQIYQPNHLHYDGTNQAQPHGNTPSSTISTRRLWHSHYI